jgi:hypothetical protein
MSFSDMPQDDFMRLAEAEAEGDRAPDIIYELIKRTKNAAKKAVSNER